MSSFKKILVTLVSEKPAMLNYIGFVDNRHYGIHEIRLDEFVMVSSKKEKLDATILFKGAKDSPGSESVTLGNANGDLFGKPKLKIVDDPFAGMIAGGKRKNDSIQPSPTKKSQYPILVSKV